MQFTDQIQEDFNNWLDETQGKFDIDEFFFEYFNQFEIELNGTKNRKMKNALSRAKFFSSFAFKPQDKDHSTFWNYITEIGNEYLDHCSSEDIMLLADQHININAPEDVGYIIFRQEYNRPLESEFYNSKTETIELHTQKVSFADYLDVCMPAIVLAGLAFWNDNSISHGYKLYRVTYALPQNNCFMPRLDQEIEEVLIPNGRFFLPRERSEAYNKHSIIDKTTEAEKRLEQIQAVLFTSRAKRSVHTRKINVSRKIDVGRIYRMSPGPPPEDDFVPEDIPF